MAKSLQKLAACKLRRKGKSIIKIASLVSVSKSTVSLWCRDIELTEEQKNKLLRSKEEGLRLGQLMGAEMQKRKRLDKIENYRNQGLKKFKNLGKRDCFVFGLALYLGEGSKYKRVKFTNSSPQLMSYMIKWFNVFFSIPKEDLRFFVVINELHKRRKNDIIRYWSKYLNIPPNQFRKTTFVRSKQKKIYENYNNYYGTIHFQVLKSANLLYKILGLIGGVFQSKIVINNFRSA